MTFTFSVDNQIVKKENLDGPARMAEKFFKIESDPNQIPITPKTLRWITTHIPNCVNVIRNKNKVIGFTFLVPTTKWTMRAFVKGKINERQLFEQTKKEFSKTKRFGSIYLCSAFVIPKYQKSGLATQGFLKSIETFPKSVNSKLTIYFDAWTTGGRKLGIKVAKKARLPYREKEN